MTVIDVGGGRRGNKGDGCEDNGAIDNRMLPPFPFGFPTTAADSRTPSRSGGGGTPSQHPPRGAHPHPPQPHETPGDQNRLPVPANRRNACPGPPSKPHPANLPRTEGLRPSMEARGTMQQTAERSRGRARNGREVVVKRSLSKSPRESRVPPRVPRAGSPLAAPQKGQKAQKGAVNQRRKGK